MSKQELIPISGGPPFYANWHKSSCGGTLNSTYEVPLLTDSRFTGMITEGYGPYQFLNCVANHDKTMCATLVLRVDNFLLPQLDRGLKTYEEHYHGGNLADEAAALASLCLGTRLKAGSISREFGPDDPKGFPRARDTHRHTLNVSCPEWLVIPSALNNQCSLDGLVPLQSLPKISPEAAGVLICAARLYQESLWICESEPELSWLLIVSAVETAAGFWRSETEEPVEKLKVSRPKLEPLLLKAGGPELLEAVATEIAPYMGATKKFIDFMAEFLPDPPNSRPPESAQHSWDKKPIRDTLKSIYHYRSRALHGGTPFPKPMCRGPMKCGEVYEEKPFCLASGTLTHNWIAKDIPIYLHTFEYMARGALLRWWNSLIC